MDSSTTRDTQMEDQCKDQTEAMVTVSRRMYTQDDFERAYPLPPIPDTPLNRRVWQACKCSKKKTWTALTSYVPVITVLRKYKVRQYLLVDCLAGLTVSFMHLPQAMGFGILASLRPEHGLYTTFFPVVLYLLFGTSPYISFGTNAVMALLTQSVVTRQAEQFVLNYHGDIGNTSVGTSSSPLIPNDEEILEVKVRTAAACCLLSGIILTAMGLLRFGFLCTYMSDSFIGGFTTAAAIHISTSQLPKMFGIRVTLYSGAGKLVLTYIDLFSKLGTAVIAEIIISIISALVLLLVKVCINERFKAKMKMPIPIDLIVVVVGTVISHFGKFQESLDVTVVGPIPNKFATPFVPSLTNAGDIIGDAIVMAILSLTMSIAMAKLMSKTHGTQFDDNQELFAYGVGNFVSGFFSCFPAATAPPRTMILSSLGAKTTLNGVPTAVFILLVILVIGQLFVSLPLSVPAAMIVVSMKDLLLQYRTLPTIWKINKYDFVTWVVTNAVGVLVDLNYGLFAGIGVSVILVVAHSQTTRGYLLSRGQAEVVFVDSSRTGARDLPSGVRVFRFDASLFFATSERFKSQLYEKVLNPLHKKKLSAKQQKILTTNKDVQAYKSQNNTTDGEIAGIHEQETEVLKITAGDDSDVVEDIVIDCSAMTYIDIGGKNTLAQVVKDYRAVGVRVILTGLHGQVRRMLEAAGFFDTFPRDEVFLEIIDAVSYIVNERTKMLQSSA